MLTLEKFEEASEVVQNVTLETKLRYSEYFTEQTGNRVWFKPENLQYTGAYKVRGAYYKISTLSEEERSRGLITASAGNHAQGVAYAAKIFGCKAVIVMPTTTPLIKINRTKSYGAEVVLYGNVYDESYDYAMKLALHGLAGMARFCSEQDWACRLSQMENQLTGAISGYLVSGVSNKGHTNTPAGCWINGLDNRDGRPYDFAEWDDTMWPAYHWTRQLPFILQSDLGMLQLPEDGQRQVHLNSYDYIHSYMRKGEYFRRYGFVSGSGWTGMGERHDDTMCGYSQGFMTQAAMVSDDVNTYSKLLEGVARLAYDGSVVEPLAYEMNPWVMHECFSYDNYAKAMDHTFGTYHMGRPGVANNPGDEGNLVQEAEIVKALALCAGVDDSTPGVLRLLPRIPWNWSGITAENLPYVKENGELVRISFSMQHDRATRRCRFHFESSQPVERLEVRLGPFPRELHTLRKTDYECQQGTDSSWVWLRNLSGSQIDEEIDLW